MSRRLVAGIFRIVVAVVVRFPNWVWRLLHGVVNLLLRIAIWRQWPLSGLWVIGLFVGIDMLFNGTLGGLLRAAQRRVRCRPNAHCDLRRLTHRFLAGGYAT